MCQASLFKGGDELFTKGEKPTVTHHYRAWYGKALDSKLQLPSVSFSC